MHKAITKELSNLFCTIKKGFMKDKIHPDCVSELLNEDSEGLSLSDDSAEKMKFQEEWKFLKKELFVNGPEALEDFMETGLDSKLEKDSIESMLDEVAAKMSKDKFLQFYSKYCLSEQISEEQRKQNLIEEMKNIQMYVLNEYWDGELVHVYYFTNPEETYSTMQRKLAEAMSLKEPPKNWKQIKYIREKENWSRRKYIRKKDFDIEDKSAWYKDYTYDPSYKEYDDAEKYDWEIENRFSQEDFSQYHDMSYEDLYSKVKDVYERLTSSALHRLKEDFEKDDEPFYYNWDIVRKLAYNIRKAVKEEGVDKDWCFSTDTEGRFICFYYTI